MSKDQEIIEEYNAAMYASNEAGYAGITAAETIRHLMKRAEAAEAKLAGLAKQKPVAWHIYQWRESPKGWDWYLTRAFASEPNNSDGWRSVALFTRPAPAADLAELVPDECTLSIAKTADRAEGWTKMEAYMEAYMHGANNMRRYILRKIKEHV